MPSRFRPLKMSVAVAVALLMSCTPATRSSNETPPAQPPTTAPPKSVMPGVPPPAQEGRTTLLISAENSGSQEVGSFSVVPGDLWIRGRCAGGKLELHVDPLAVLPIPCDELGDLPFQNQITLRRARQMSLSVVATEDVTWSVRVEQDRGSAG